MALGAGEVVSEVSAAREISAHRGLIRRNAFLEEIHFDAYRRILQAVPPDRFPRLLEIGSEGLPP
jgi:hypothetical protein